MRLTYSDKNILVYEINLRDYFIRLSVLIACVPTKLYYKCQMFLWWRLFTSFADCLKVLRGGIHFKLIKSFLVVERRWCRCSFSLLKLINRRFLERAIIKIFQYIFSTSPNCLYNFVVAAGILDPKSYVLFPIFFFLALLPLSYRQGKFRTSSAIRSSEAATGGVL